MSKFLFLKRACLLIILLQITGNLVRAQKPYYNQRPEFLKANSVWAFGLGGGLDFNSGGPSIFQTQMNSHEGCASVADPATRKLLFYSTGGEVWDANHSIMPNGDGLLGNYSGQAFSYSTAQGVCIVPVINDPDKWYLFSLSGFTSGGPMPEGTLFYNIIDMKLNNGMGDIVPGKKNIALDRSFLSEAMIAVPGDNCDVWLIVHGQNTPEYKAYHITKDGIDTIPVISNTGVPLQYTVGSMAISPDRSKVAFADFYSGVVSIAEFNPASGLVTNEKVIEPPSGFPSAPYSVCFSPDNSKLYANGQRGVWQFDLTIYTTQAITNSFNTVSSLRFSYSGLKLYNDTIYYYKGKDMSRINQPNLLGSACDVQELVIPNVHKGTSNKAINNDVVLPLPNDTIYDLAFDSLVCSTDFQLNAPDGFTEYQWDDGNNGLNRSITMPGTYWVLSKDFCNTRIDTFIVSGMDLVHPVINVKERTLGTVASYKSYQWMLNGNIIEGATDSNYTVTENGNYQVIVSSKAGCVDTSDVYEVTNADEPNHIEDITFLAEQVRVFPNPAKDIVHIIAPIEVSVGIYSVDGKLIKRAESTKQVNVEELSSGLYFLKIHDLKGRLLKSEKLVK